MGFCIMNISKIKSFGQMSAAFNHNYRINYADNVIPEMEVYNQELVPMSHETYNETYKAFTQDLGYGIDKDYRKNGVLALEIMLSFSRESLPTIDTEKWKEDNLKWLRENFNACPEKYGDNILSAVYHADEVGNVHMHALVAPVNDKGRLDAFYYIDGRNKLRELQTSYAKAMEPHGLERGMEHSPIKHQDIQKMYGQLNKALNVDIPKWEEKDTPETYQEKVREYTKDKVAVFLKQMNDKERELAKAKEAPKIETAALEKQLAKANRKIYKLEREHDELERELGPVTEVKKVMKSVSLLHEGLKNDMETDKANEFIEQLNLIVSRQRKREKENRKRKETVFEK